MCVRGTSYHETHLFVHKIWTTPSRFESCSIRIWKTLSIPFSRNDLDMSRWSPAARMYTAFVRTDPVRCELILDITWLSMIRLYGQIVIFVQNSSVHDKSGGSSRKQYGPCLAIRFKWVPPSWLVPYFLCWVFGPYGSKRSTTGWEKSVQLYLHSKVCCANCTFSSYLLNSLFPLDIVCHAEVIEESVIHFVRWRPIKPTQK